jgi:two-component system, oxyanion-binding sensor
LRIGFVPLIDAASLIVAKEHGLFRAEGLDVQLHRQIGWANVRDKLTFGHLDASHALMGMPLISHLGRDWFVEPLVAIMALGSGGNAMTLGREFAEAGIDSAASLGAWLRSHQNSRQLIIGHVFGCSMQNYLLRDWLASAGIDPDRDVRLCVIPPPQMPEHMAKGYLDGFCVGEPWNTLAEERGCGSVIACGNDIIPNHPEKVLAVTQRWAKQHPETLEPLIRAVLRACVYCQDPANQPELAALLARPEYVGVPVESIARCLAAGPGDLGSAAQRRARQGNWRIRSFAAEHTFPSKLHPAWLLREMIRWHELSPETDVLDLASRCSMTEPYRAAAAALGIACPPDDYPPMALRNGRVFDLAAAQVCGMAGEYVAPEAAKVGMTGRGMLKHAGAVGEWSAAKPA